MNQRGRRLGSRRSLVTPSDRSARSTLRHTAGKSCQQEVHRDLLWLILLGPDIPRFQTWFPEVRGPKTRPMRTRVFAGICLSLLTLATANAVEPSPAPPPAAVLNAANAKAFDPQAATQAWL